ncbi:tyrosine-protein phosphatase RLPH2-like [Salvia splendens]|uniref:tyrosine-protein phosphatase RLPH2-like n=1 Tax=Salvia splendens TaxID=180675 RepID=UPI001C271C53|nr:tyrosine-protein phosphatase RLPH2-like [Salvia splendens]
MATTGTPTTVCCVGDIHGFITKLEQAVGVGSPDFQSALIIFLGDYCDRGPNTNEVLDFLISLPSNYPNQRHVFLCGNHDFAFSAFLGLLPGSDFSATWTEYAMNEEREREVVHVEKEIFRRSSNSTMAMAMRICIWWAGRMIGFNRAKSTDYQGSIYDAAHPGGDLNKTELSETPTIVVSGHHGKVHIVELRLIIDQGGGMVSNPVAPIKDPRARH